MTFKKSLKSKIKFAKAFLKFFGNYIGESQENSDDTSSVALGVIIIFGLILASIGGVVYHDYPF